ncbi:MAG: NAD-dependent epimerase/dehydratase family protein [Tetragenococcus koreensis]|nr:NAD-dependent epimerase/dehydratase family protein [Tetragenococcus koreensis]
MKRILITGKNSYIGNSFEEWIADDDNFYVEKISLREDNWKSVDFSKYDAILHVAGIAHADISKVNSETKDLYYKINCDLAIEVVKKYKEDLNGKIGQFIYMSSIIIYGEEANINKRRVITQKTVPLPTNFYGDSKLKAEKKLVTFDSDLLKITILRPPMIYGPGSKGNYRQLEKIAKYLPIFPDIRNERSILSVGNLCYFIKERIISQDSGIFLPQDEEYMRTSYMVKNIGKRNGKKIILIPWANWLVRLMGHFPGKVGKLTNKAFGNLVYEKKF